MKRCAATIGLSIANPKTSSYLTDSTVEPLNRPADEIRQSWTLVSLEVTIMVTCIRN